MTSSIYIYDAVSYIKNMGGLIVDRSIIWRAVQRSACTRPQQLMLFQGSSIDHKQPRLLYSSSMPNVRISPYSGRRMCPLLTEYNLKLIYYVIPQYSIYCRIIIVNEKWNSIKQGDLISFLLWSCILYVHEGFYTPSQQKSSHLLLKWQTAPYPV